jgi:hypothetical protein
MKSEMISKIRFQGRQWKGWIISCPMGLSHGAIPIWETTSNCQITSDFPYLDDLISYIWSKILRHNHRRDKEHFFRDMQKEWNRRSLVSAKIIDPNAWCFRLDRRMRASVQDEGTYFSGSARMAVPLAGLEVMNVSGPRTRMVTWVWVKWTSSYLKEIQWIDMNRHFF